MKHDNSRGKENYPSDKSNDSHTGKNAQPTTSPSVENDPRDSADSARIGWTGLGGPNRQEAAGHKESVYKSTVTDGGQPAEIEAAVDDEVATALDGVITAADAALTDEEIAIISEAADRLRDDAGDDPGTEEIRADGGAVARERDAEVLEPDTTKFQLRILAILADEARYGLAIKRELEGYYGNEVNHGRLYPNLDDLVEAGLAEKSELDRRTNEYSITDRGFQALVDELGWLADRGNLKILDKDGEV